MTKIVIIKLFNINKKVFIILIKVQIALKYSHKIIYYFIYIFLHN